MFDALQDQVRREFRRTSWRDTLWAGLFGLLVSPILVYLVSMLFFEFPGLELSMDLDWSERGKIEVRGLHPLRTIASLLVTAWIVAIWVRPKLHAWRMKRLWGN